MTTAYLLLVLKLMLCQISHTNQHQISSPQQNARMEVSVESNNGPLITPCYTSINMYPVISLKSDFSPSPIVTNTPLEDSEFSLIYVEDLIPLFKFNISDLITTATPCSSLDENRSLLTDPAAILPFAEAISPTIERIPRIAPLITTPLNEKKLSKVAPVTPATDRSTLAPTVHNINPTSQVGLTAGPNTKFPLKEPQCVENRNLKNTFGNIPSTDKQLPNSLNQQKFQSRNTDTFVDNIQYPPNKNFQSLPFEFQPNARFNDHSELCLVQNKPQNYRSPIQESSINTAMTTTNNFYKPLINKPDISDTVPSVDLSISKYGRHNQCVNTDYSKSDLVFRSKPNVGNSMSPLYNPYLNDETSDPLFDLTHKNNDKVINDPKILPKSAFVPKITSTIDGIGPKTETLVGTDTNEKIFSNLKFSGTERNLPPNINPKPLINISQNLQQQNLVDPITITTYPNISPSNYFNEKSFFASSQNTQNNKNFADNIYTPASSFYGPHQQNSCNPTYLSEISQSNYKIAEPFPSNTQLRPSGEYTAVHTSPNYLANSYPCVTNFNPTLTPPVNPLETKSSINIDTDMYFVSEKHWISPNTNHSPPKKFVPDFKLNSPPIKSPSVLPKPIMKDPSPSLPPTKAISISVPSLQSTSPDTCKSNTSSGSINPSVISIVINIIPNPQEAVSEIIIII